MKKIYLSHSTSIEYDKLYESLGKIEDAKFVFPHISVPKNSKTIIKKGSKLSSSLKLISKRFIEYKNFDEARFKVGNELRRI